MSRLSSAFEGHKALVTYITAGDPDLAVTADCVACLDASGADIIELGVPFSDPQADGPIIQRAGQRALRKGVTLKKVLAFAGDLKGRIRAPLVLMGYYNPILNYQEERFAHDAAEAGVSGVIVPDLPFDEGGRLYGALERHGVDAVLMATPNAVPDRLAAVGSRSRGFLYCVSLLGVTGTGKSLHEGLEAYMARVRKATSLPLALGFGIDGPEKARLCASFADGVVVGSALVRLAEAFRDDAPRLLEETGRLVRSLRAVLDEVQTTGFQRPSA